MSIIKIRGIVIKETTFGEGDKIITVLSKSYGKISVYAKGAKKKIVGTNLFSYCDFMLFQGSKMYNLNQADLIESFYSLSLDLDKLACGSYFLEVVNRTIYENQQCDDILFLLLKALQSLSKETLPFELVLRIFEIKYIQLYGYTPEVHTCRLCGKSPLEIIYFDAEGVLCENCKLNNSLFISPTVLHAIRFIFSTETKNLFSFNIPQNDIEILAKISELLFNKYINIKFSSYNFLKEIKTGISH